MVPPSKDKKMETGPGKVLEATYDDGKPAEPDKWRDKLDDRDKKLRYLQSGERYWYSEDGGFGSERRKTKA